ncbi:hypothetical protein [Elstera sp.]|jgi:hypothetical protein|uniref:hypothetical protein n=1 Tax=Elstera sp. TaxID=1916664 RepID=UPI0037BF33CF
MIHKKILTIRDTVINKFKKFLEILTVLSSFFSAVAAISACAAIYFTYKSALISENSLRYSTKPIISISSILTSGERFGLFYSNIGNGPALSVKITVRAYEESIENIKDAIGSSLFKPEENKKCLRIAVSNYDGNEIKSNSAEADLLSVAYNKNNESPEQYCRASFLKIFSEGNIHIQAEYKSIMGDIYRKRWKIEKDCSPNEESAG